ncbi:urease accessory protein [Enhydrobacter aerosaccus]|uniref:Urease accessory protein UreD n=1 Tax=Enhydrobacter aerosaccus TaxID=225324 RepID=A0A1T4NCQ0_9HYPH|nr:urease accessory protein UreD [Enhydrobacter aerosaccus]SJZ76893.1 urease accessory protein [Enhydrobacter aerosaccus]
MNASTRPGLQRASGQSRVVFAHREGRTRLADLYQRDPCRILFPVPEPGDPPQAVLVTTSGGVTGGDRLRMAVEVGPEARAEATSQAAEKIYRAAADSGDCIVDVALEVGDGAALDWLPQETIVFEGARLRRRTVADIGPGGALLACEMVVLGRAASGERFTSGLLLDAWSVRREGRLVWTDALRVEGETPHGAGFGAGNALATVILANDAPQEPLARARALLEQVADVRAGVTLVNGIVVARLLGEATRVRAAAVALLAGLRGRRLPKVWHV